MKKKIRKWLIGKGWVTPKHPKWVCYVHEKVETCVMRLAVMAENKQIEFLPIRVYNMPGGLQLAAPSAPGDTVLGFVCNCNKENILSILETTWFVNGVGISPEQKRWLRKVNPSTGESVEVDIAPPKETVN